jgi:hypothetical protein
MNRPSQGQRAESLAQDESQRRATTWLGSGVECPLLVDCSRSVRCWASARFTEGCHTAAAVLCFDTAQRAHVRIRAAAQAVRLNDERAPGP